MVVGSQTSRAVPGRRNYQPTNLPTDTLTQVVVQASSTIKVTNAGSGVRATLQSGCRDVHGDGVAGFGALLHRQDRLVLRRRHPITAPRRPVHAERPVLVTCMEPSGSLILGTHASPPSTARQQLLGRTHIGPVGQVVKQTRRRSPLWRRCPTAARRTVRGRPAAPRERHRDAAGSGNALTPTGTVTFTTPSAASSARRRWIHGTATCTGGYSSPNFTVATPVSLTITRATAAISPSPRRDQRRRASSISPLWLRTPC